jgi:2-oxo-4-hydroxy-4-carboxy-5-ureidoimidazoline decarboxylase
MSESYSIPQFNAMSHEDFTHVCGPVFERSPWIAADVAARRPFENFDELFAAMCERVRGASAEEKLTLIRAHPDLVGRMTLTDDSRREQASAGLTELSEPEIDWFRQQNAVYRERFGFPFIICARLNKKEAIMAGFTNRLAHSREQEMETALGEIFKIAELRLRDLCPER